ncbi:hypothetical protein RirG_167840 [Rhizophagus irregularis DAOM 197198w]|uniref:Uncharacterized protein n=1 Tax=Rhizophagus irregularis (strain DAOM 197198w) TaxID=1432141 RepID=A0A015J4Z6_RHIIW|nr:hypothetical protein RirG_167840 [Rhizophagus irregularis DAOM 197198w]
MDETGKIYCMQTVYMIRCAEYRIYTVCENTVIILDNDAPDDFNASEDTPDGFNTSVLPERSQFLPFKLDCSATIVKSNKIHRGNNKIESASKSQSNRVTNNKRRIISTNLPESKHQKCQDSITNLLQLSESEEEKYDSYEHLKSSDEDDDEDKTEQVFTSHSAKKSKCN